ncbi:hypothetical protein TWF694_006592 [Orbilia ellipsospora]|uniref:Bicarbonate transporter-like transmembrane domain-containing protein n=1 Tax=Orbilia ellipsospora TaxID=2528407 RepID=A0AAV9XKJ4_9PEZI
MTDGSDRSQNLAVPVIQNSSSISSASSRTEIDSSNSLSRSRDQFYPPSFKDSSMPHSLWGDETPSAPPTDEEMQSSSNEPEARSKKQTIASLFNPNGVLRPFRLMKKEFRARSAIYHTDWHFNQLIFASAVFVFFTNLLPGITFASDLDALTGSNYGTIEVVFSTGLCGVIFALWVWLPFLFP